MDEFPHLLLGNQGAHSGRRPTGVDLTDPPESGFVFEEHSDGKTGPGSPHEPLEQVWEFELISGHAIGVVLGVAGSRDQFAPTMAMNQMFQIALRDLMMGAGLDVLSELFESHELALCGSLMEGLEQFFLLIQAQETGSTAP